MQLYLPQIIHCHWLFYLLRFQLQLQQRFIEDISLLLKLEISSDKDLKLVFPSAFVCLFVLAYASSGILLQPKRAKMG